MMIPKNCPICKAILLQGINIKSRCCDQEDHSIYFSDACNAISLRINEFINIDWNYDNNNIHVNHADYGHQTIDWIEPDFSDLIELESKIKTLILLL